MTINVYYLPVTCCLDIGEIVSENKWKCPRFDVKVRARKRPYFFYFQGISHVSTTISVFNSALMDVQKKENIE